jgi:hypothetical protein
MLVINDLIFFFKKSVNKSKKCLPLSPEINSSYVVLEIL